MLKELLSELKLSRYIAFDCETTGLRYEEDHIIEFSAILFENGDIKQKLSFLCDPGVTITPEIEWLTGITNEIVKGQLPFEKRINEVLEFIGDLPLVAHNISFDLSFLKAYLKRCPGSSKKRVTNRLFDTLLLAQAFLFYLYDHKLGTVAEYYGRSAEGAHRAESDAINTGNIFLKMIEQAARYDLETIQTINLILQDTRDPNKWLYRLLSERMILHRTMGDSYAPQIDWTTRLNQLTFNDSRKNEQEWIASISDLFGEKGLIAKSLPDFELRPQQIEMAKTVQRCLQTGTSGLIEAGTGVGKSLAYLLPGVLWLNREKDESKRLVIASNTKNLQEQIFYKEIPFLGSKLDLSIKAVMLKGRSNYICLTRWYSLLRDIPNKVHIANRSSLISIVIWLKHTRTGDISENNGFKMNRNRFIWNEICSEPGYCTTSICKKYDGCYLGQLHDAAFRSNLLVVNHSLLLADAAADNKVLPEYHALIIDEAHNLEKNAYNYFAARINQPRINYILNSLSSGTSNDNGILITLGQLFQQMHLPSILLNDVERIKGTINTVRLDAGGFFKNIIGQKYQNKAAGTKRYGIKKRFHNFKDEIIGELPDVFQSSLNTLIQQLRSLLEKIDSFEAEALKILQEFRLNLKNSLVNLEEYCTTLQTIISGDCTDLIFWYEISSGDREIFCELACTPLNIADDLYKNIYQKLHATLLTSATLQVAESFEYIKQRTGFDRFERGSMIESAVGSPYHFEDQVMFCTYHADRTRANNTADIASLVYHLSAETKRGILVLFTSYSVLNEVYRVLTPRFKQLGVTMLAQGIGASPSILLDQFRKERNSVLLGTDSFWEGVDVIGNSLEILVIQKLPFAVPTEPLIEANIEKLTEEGHNAFFEYSVPEAALKFRQGFGRLIRSGTDIGVVINLDDRIDKKRYGQVFKRSLPVEALSFAGENNLLKSVTDFFSRFNQ